MSVYRIFASSPSWARTNNPTVNSRVLYHWAIEDYLIFALFSSVCDRVVALPLSYRGWFSFLYSLSFYGNLQKEPLWSSLSDAFFLCTFKTTHCFLTFSNLLRSSLRPISFCQLNMLPCLHLRPIYLVVFKGSYDLTIWDILSWGGLHA